MKRAKTLVLVGISFAGILYGQTQSHVGSGVNNSSPSVSLSETERGNSCINPASDSNADGLQTIASDWTMRAMLTHPVDVKKNKPGDPVTARTMQSSKTLDGRTMPKGTELVGHVTQAQPRSEEQSYSELGIVFDKAILKDGQELPLISNSQGSPNGTQASLLTSNSKDIHLNSGVELLLSPAREPDLKFGPSPKLKRRFAGAVKLLRVPWQDRLIEQPNGCRDFLPRPDGRASLGS